MPLEDGSPPSVGWLIGYFQMNHHATDSLEQIPIDSIGTAEEVPLTRLAEDESRQSFLVRNRPCSVLDPVDQQIRLTLPAEQGPGDG